MTVCSKANLGKQQKNHQKPALLARCTVNQLLTGDPYVLWNHQ